MGIKKGCILFNIEALRLLVDLIDDVISNHLQHKISPYQIVRWIFAV